MTHASNQISPLDAEYVEHREAAERRRETREWLKKRETELGFIKDAPPVVPGTISERGRKADLVAICSVAGRDGKP